MKTAAFATLFILLPLSASAAPTADGPSEKPVLRLAEESTGSGQGAWMVSIAVASACIALFALAKQRQRSTVESANIRVVSERALGAKVRLVLIEAHGRELLLSVSDRGAELVAEWSSQERFDELVVEERTPPKPRELRQERERPDAAPPVSAALDGLMRLRARTKTPEPEPELARSELFGPWSKHVLRR